MPSCARAADEVQAMWIGHASLLVQMHGVTFLTDPVLSERCSFSQVCAPWPRSSARRCGL